MAEMTEVIVFTVTGVDIKNIDSITERFSEQIQGEVGSHIKFGTDLVFSAIAPKSIFTRARWAGLLRSISKSQAPVKWRAERVMDW
jgi:hypothetical protein